AAQAVCQMSDELLGSPVTPAATKVLAAAMAPASADLCDSLFATYKEATSIANAAMAKTTNIVSAASSSVTPRSLFFHSWISLALLIGEINPGLISRRPN